MNERALAAEFVGTFSVVGAICGAALFSMPAGGGLIGYALAPGLAVLVMAYAVGQVSGGHFNPAVTLGLVAGGRFKSPDAVGYILAQVLGGLAAAFVFSIVLSGAPVGQAATKWNSFLGIANTFGPGKFSLMSVFLVEAVCTALFLMVIMGATSKHVPPGFAPIAMGLSLTVFHLMAIPVSNASFNPARSTAIAVVAGGQALGDLWVFWVAPIVGAVLGGVVSRWLQDEQ
jgi:aquaporin Z